MKKIGIFPLAGMILCGMVSLSSGLDYYTRSLLFVIPIVFHVLLYYVVYHFIKAANDKKRQNYSFLISIGRMCFFFSFVFKIHPIRISKYRESYVKIGKQLLFPWIDRSF